MDFTAMTTLPLDTSLAELESVVAKIRATSQCPSNLVKVSLTPDTQRIHVVAHWDDVRTH